MQGGVRWGAAVTRHGLLVANRRPGLPLPRPSPPARGVGPEHTNTKKRGPAGRSARAARPPPPASRAPIGQRGRAGSTGAPPPFVLAACTAWRLSPHTLQSPSKKKKKKTLRLGGWIAQERLPSSFTCALASPPSEAAQPEGGALFPAELSRGGGFREEGLLPPPPRPARAIMVITRPPRPRSSAAWGRPKPRTAVGGAPPPTVLPPAGAAAAGWGVGDGLDRWGWWVGSGSGRGEWRVGAARRVRMGAKRMGVGMMGQDADHPPLGPPSFLGCGGGHRVGCHGRPPAPAAAPTLSPPAGRPATLNHTHTPSRQAHNTHTTHSHARPHGIYKKDNPQTHRHTRTPPQRDRERERHTHTHSHTHSHTTRHPLTEPHSTRTSTPRFSCSASLSPPTTPAHRCWSANDGSRSTKQ